MGSVENEGRLLEQERLILAATEAVWAEMARQGIKKSDLAERLGTSKAYVTQALDGGRNLTLRTLSDFAWALDSRIRVSIGPIASVSGSFSTGPAALTHQTQPAGFVRAIREKVAA